MCQRVSIFRSWAKRTVSRVCVVAIEYRFERPNTARHDRDDLLFAMDLSGERIAPGVLGEVVSAASLGFVKMLTSLISLYRISPELRQTFVHTEIEENMVLSVGGQLRLYCVV